tara:strand:+ start:260 stop:400 length:141 start_codon:yes stop_codon:yes gene_type:complete
LSYEQHKFLVIIASARGKVIYSNLSNKGFGGHSANLTAAMQGFIWN